MPSLARRIFSGIRGRRSSTATVPMATVDAQLESNEWFSPAISPDDRLSFAAWMDQERLRQQQYADGSVSADDTSAIIDPSRVNIVEEDSAGSEVSSLSSYQIITTSRSSDLFFVSSPGSVVSSPDTISEMIPIGINSEDSASSATLDSMTTATTTPVNRAALLAGSERSYNRWDATYTASYLEKARDALYQAHGHVNDLTDSIVDHIHDNEEVHIEEARYETFTRCTPALTSGSYDSLPSLTSTIDFSEDSAEQSHAYSKGEEEAADAQLAHGTKRKWDSISRLTSSLTLDDIQEAEEEVRALSRMRHNSSSTISSGELCPLFYDYSSEFPDEVVIRYARNHAVSNNVTRSDHHSTQHTQHNREGLGGSSEPFPLFCDYLNDSADEDDDQLTPLIRKHEHDTSRPRSPTLVNNAGESTEDTLQDHPFQTHAQHHGDLQFDDSAQPLSIRDDWFAESEEVPEGKVPNSGKAGAFALEGSEDSDFKSYVDIDDDSDDDVGIFAFDS